MVATLGSMVVPIDGSFGALSNGTADKSGVTFGDTHFCTAYEQRPAQTESHRGHHPHLRLEAASRLFLPHFAHRSAAGEPGRDPWRQLERALTLSCKSWSTTTAANSLTWIVPRPSAFAAAWRRCDKSLRAVCGPLKPATMLL